jgi:hypothetical protein
MTKLLEQTKGQGKRILCLNKVSQTASEIMGALITNKIARCWCLTPIILATSEAEMGRMVV